MKVTGAEAAAEAALCITCYAEQSQGFHGVASIKIFSSRLAYQ
jgi:hypothetical protein